MVSSKDFYPSIFEGGGGVDLEDTHRNRKKIAIMRQGDKTFEVMRRRSELEEELLWRRNVRVKKLGKLLGGKFTRSHGVNGKD